MNWFKKKKTVSQIQKFNYITDVNKWLLEEADSIEKVVSVSLSHKVGAEVYIVHYEVKKPV